MKKIIGIFIVLIIGIISVWFYTLYQSDYVGVGYYVKITEKGQRVVEDGHVKYEYSLEGINEKGEVKVLDFYVLRDEPLKMDRYLLVMHNPNRGVLSWEEVFEKDIPQSVLEHLNKK